MELATKNYKHIKYYPLIGILLLITTTQCTVVKEYEKQYINDKNMDLTNQKIEKFETNFQIYREGASGANGGKSGGGCGCN